MVGRRGLLTGDFAGLSGAGAYTERLYTKPAHWGSKRQNLADSWVNSRGKIFWGELLGVNFGVNFWGEMAAALHGGRPSLISRGTLSGGDRRFSEIKDPSQNPPSTSLEADPAPEGAPVGGQKR